MADEPPSKRLKTAEEDDGGQYSNTICTAFNEGQHPLIKALLANEVKSLNEIKSYTNNDPLYELSKQISEEAETTQFTHSTIKFQGKAVGTGEFEEYTYVFDSHKEKYQTMAKQDEEGAKKRYVNTFYAETKVYEWQPCVDAAGEEYNHTPKNVLKRVKLMLDDRLEQTNSDTCASDFAQMVDGKMDPERRIEYVDNKVQGEEAEKGKSFARHIKSLTCAHETLTGIIEADADKAAGKKTMAGGIAMMRGQYYESMTHFDTEDKAKAEYLRLASSEKGIGVPVVSLGIVNADSSEWCGSLKLEYYDDHVVDGCMVKYNNSHGYHITPETRQYAFGCCKGWKKISSNALFIILVEGGSVYQTFINCEIWRWIPCIVLCSHGLSKENSIAFGTMLSKIFDIPFYGGGLDVNGVSNLSNQFD